MLFWIITGVLLLVGVGVYFSTHDEARHTKRKLRLVRQRLEELEREKAEQRQTSTD